METKLGNIQLTYRLRVHHKKVVYNADGAEVFLDEHNVQWIKFFPSNGPYASEEHMIRTDQCFVTRQGVGS